MEIERKRRISILTVLLWIALIAVMIVITVNGIINKNAIEGETEESEITKDVELAKNAEWVDKEKGIAKVTLKVNGDKIAVGQSDVELIIDKSGTMTFADDFWNSGMYYKEDGITKLEENAWPEKTNIPNDINALEHSPCTNTSHWVNGEHYYDPDNAIEGQKQDLYDKEQGCTDRFDIVVEAVNKFLDIYLDPKYNNRVAYVSFAGNVNDECNYGIFTHDKTKISNDDPENLGILQITQKNFACGTDYLHAFYKGAKVIETRNLEETGNMYIGDNPTYVIFFTDGQPDPEIYQNGVGAVFGDIHSLNSIQYIQNKTDEIFAIGLSVTDDKYLSKIATNENDLYLVQDANELIPLFEELAGKLLSAGTDAYITDVISEDFEYYEDETHQPTEGAILLPPESEDGKTIKWYQSEVTPDTTTYEFYIKVKEGEEHENGNWPTNDLAEVTYKNKEGEDETVTVENPILGRHRYDVEYYLEQEDGSYQLEEKESYWVEEGEKVVAKVKSYEKYTFNKEVEGTVLEGVIEETGRTVLKLYYDKLKSNVVVRYVDRNGIDIAEKIELIGKVGEKYTTERKEIEGYVAYGKDPENAEGVYTEEGQEVIYVYEKLVGTVRIEYVDKEGKGIANSEIIEGKVGEEYVTERKEIAGYKAYGEDPENAHGKYINGEIVVRYIYEKEVVETGDQNIWIYVIISLVAIVGIIYVVYFSMIRKKVK